MRSILRLPKLPTLKPKVVGILVIAAVLVVVFAVQKSPDGFQNPLSKAEPLSVKDAEALLMNAQNALTAAKDEYYRVTMEQKNQRDKLIVKEQEKRTAETKAAETKRAAIAADAALVEAVKVVAEVTRGVENAIAAAKRLQSDLELKQKAVENAHQALDNARRAQQLPTTNTKCPYTTLESEKLVDSNSVNPIMPPCPACYTAVGFVRAGLMPWSGMMFRCLRNDIVQRDPKMWFQAANEALALAQRAQKTARWPHEAAAAQARIVAAQADVKAAQAALQAAAQKR